MNLHEAIHTRRAVRAYKPDIVDEATLRQLLQEAIQAPSAMNAQPWVFSIVQDRARLRRYSDLAKSQMLKANVTEPKVRSYADILRDETFNIFYDAGTLIAIGVRARTEFSDASTASVSRSRRAPEYVPSNNECGVCRPNTVMVWAPDSRRAGDRMLGSVSEWQ